MPAESAENWLTSLGFVATGALVLLGMWIKSYFAGRAEAGEPKPRQFVLEHAELANLGALPTQLQALGPRLDSIFTLDQSNRIVLEQNNEFLKQNNEMMRKMVEILSRIEQDGQMRARMDILEEAARVAQKVADGVLSRK